MPLLPELFVVEDDLDDRDLFSRAVLASGLAVRLTFAQDAPEAVMRFNRMGDYAGTPLPDVIILDLSLPGVQGKTLLQVIRHAYGSRAVPVVILTGSTQERDRIDCEYWGISDYSLKPQSLFELTEFVARLARFLPEGTVCNITPPFLPTSSSPRLAKPE